MEPYDVLERPERGVELPRSAPLSANSALSALKTNFFDLRPLTSMFFRKQTPPLQLGDTVYVPARVIAICEKTGRTTLRLTLGDPALPQILQLPAGAFCVGPEPFGLANPRPPIAEAACEEEG